MKDDFEDFRRDSVEIVKDVKFILASVNILAQV
jgi:hypothetical protein